jgi:protoporphyrinogen oxidase
MAGPRPSIAVIGGGIMGLAAAAELTRAGRFDITLYEGNERLGGHCAGLSLADTICDRFYHVVLPGDTATIGWIEELGLGSNLVWSRAGSGFFGDGRLVPLETSLDFLRFPFLSPIDKVRLAIGILRAGRIRNPEGPAAVSTEVWLNRLFGPRVTEKIWNPLMRSKWGEASPRISASFIWASIRRLRGARRGPAGRERLGALRPGIHALVEAAERRLGEDGVRVCAGRPVLAVERGEAGRVRVRTASGEAFHEAVLATLPEPALRAILPPGPAGAEPPTEHLGVLAVVLALKTGLSPYYVINLLDESLPFTGIIETTNVLPAADFGGRRLVYLPKYLTAGDPLNGRSDEEVSDLFLSALSKVFPGLAKADIIDHRVVRAPYAQPLHAPGQGLPAADFRTAFPGLFAVHTTMITRSLHNIDADVRLAREAARTIVGEFSARKPVHA